MGFYKLRDWVGTVTGKGVRWGRAVGRSAPAFMAASTTALPHLPALYGKRQANFVGSCCFAARPANCGPFVCCEACAGRRIRWLCLPAVPCSAGFVCLLAFAMPWPLPFSCSCPRSVHFALPLFIPCAPGSSCCNMFASCKTVLLAAATRACRGGPCTDC